MRVIPLQSGSAGNCCYVEAAGARILIDAGISAARARHRLAEHGVDIVSLDGVFITHEHADHIAAAGVFARKLGLTLYCTEGTWRAARDRLGDVGPVARAATAGAIDFGDAWRGAQRRGGVRLFAAGEAVEIAGARIESLATPHDAADGVVYCVDDGRARLGVCTDFGHVFPELRRFVATLDGALIESNYDEDMLDGGPYPLVLKRRIAGPRGHISNREAAELVARDGGRLRWACLAHLSENNNTPELALAAHRAALGDAFALHLTQRYGASEPLEL